MSTPGKSLGDPGSSKVQPTLSLESADGLAVALVERRQLLDLRQDRLAAVFQLGGEASPCPQKKVGPGLVPEDCPAVVEEEGEVAGGTGEEGHGEADPESQVAAGEPAFGDPGQGEEEERPEDLVGGGLVRIAGGPLHDRPDQTVGGIVEDRPDRRHGQVDQQAQQGPPHEPRHRRRRIGRSDLVVPEVEGLQEMVVLADASGRGGDLFRMARPQVPVPLQEGTAEGHPLGQAPPGRQRELAVAVEVRGAGDQTGVLPSLIVEGDLVERAVDAGGELAGGGDRILRVQGDLRRRVERLPHLHQHPRAEGLLGVEEEADGDDPRPQAGKFPLRLQDDPRGARLERLERGGAVARPLGEEGEHAPARQQLVGAGEGLGVLGGVRALVLPAVDGDRPGPIDERADQRVLPQGALGQEPRHHRQGTHQQDGVDQAVDVVRHQHQGAVERDALGSRHLDLPEKDPEDEADEGAEGAVGAPHHPDPLLPALPTPFRGEEGERPRRLLKAPSLPGGWVEGWERGGWGNEGPMIVFPFMAHLFPWEGARLGSELVGVPCRISPALSIRDSVTEGCATLPYESLQRRALRSR
jgi:hypothetical protein